MAFRNPKVVLCLILVVTGSLLFVGCRGGSAESGFLARGKELLAKKDYARAILDFKNAARLDPKSAEPYYQASFAYLAMGDHRTAYLSLLRATELDPKHTGAQVKLAEMIGSSVGGTSNIPNLQEAEKRVKSVLAIVPDSADALGALGLTEYLLGKPDDAVKHLEAALEKFPQHLQSAKALALIKLNEKDFAGAEQILKKVADESPRSAEAQVALARFFVLSHRVEDAVASYHRAVSIDPNYGPALLDLARLQLASGQKEDGEKTLLALSKLPDRQYRPLHAIFLFEQGKQDEALKEFERQAAQDPKDHEAFLRLTSAYFFTKRFPEAERTINAALQKNAKDATALQERSKLYLITAKFAEAQSDLDQVLRAQPDSATAHYLLSKVYQARGQQLMRRQQLGESVRLDPKLLGARLELARALVSEGGAKNALELLDHSPVTQKDLLPVILERNRALLGLDAQVELRKSIDHGLALYKSPDLLLQDGLLKLRKKDLAGARKSFELVLAAEPENTDALDALAKSYIFQKQPALALKTVEAYTAQRPGSAALQSLLGDWLGMSKQFAAARKAFVAALAADPSLVRVRIALAYLDISEGKLEPARLALEPIARVPVIAAQAETALAVLEEKAGNTNAAIVHYRKVLEADPNNLPALNNLAYYLSSDTDKLDEALKFAQQAKELDPNGVYVEDTIGWVLYRKGLYGSAVKHLEGAVAKQATAQRKYHLAMAYLKAGDRQRGRQVLEQALKMNADLPEAAAALDLMHSMGSEAN